MNTEWSITASKGQTPDNGLALVESDAGKHGNVPRELGDDLTDLFTRASVSFAVTMNVP